MLDSGIYVWIESKDRAVYHEHKYNEMATGRKECWIESKQGKNFTICWRFVGTTTDCLQAEIWLDGIRVGGGLLRPEQLHQTFRMSGRDIGSNRKLPFQFGKLNLTDDERVAPQDDPNLGELNTIRIVVQFATLISYTDAPTLPKMRETIHERAAKQAHNDLARLGEPTRAMPRRWCQTKKLPHLGRFEFVFRYAPYDWLTAHNIISEPPTPVRSPSKVISNSRSPTKTPQAALETKSRPLAPKRAHTPNETIGDSDGSDVLVLSDVISSPDVHKNKRRRTKKHDTMPRRGASSSNRARSPTNGVIDLSSSDVEFV